MGSTYSPVWAFTPQIKALFAIYPVDPLMIDMPALTSKQGMDTKIAVTNSCLGYLPNPQPKDSIVFAVRNISKRSPAEQDHLTGAALADTVRLLQVPYKITPLGWL